MKWTYRASHGGEVYYMRDELLLYQPKKSK